MIHRIIGSVEICQMKNLQPFVFFNFDSMLQVLESAVEIIKKKENKKKIIRTGRYQLSCWVAVSSTLTLHGRQTGIKRLYAVWHYELGYECMGICLRTLELALQFPLKN